MSPRQRFLSRLYLQDLQLQLEQHLHNQQMQIHYSYDVYVCIILTERYIKLYTYCLPNRARIVYPLKIYTSYQEEPASSNNKIAAR